MEPDEVWAYRARSVDDVTPVRVLRIGTKKPARVLVRFEDPAKEGHEEWVPPVRLKVPWADAETFRAREARWAAVLKLSPDRDAPEAGAASEVFEMLVDDEVADLDWRDAYLRISDVDRLARLSGLSAAELSSDPVGFAEDGDLIASWPLALKVAQGVAALHADKILAQVVKEERKYQHDRIHGEHVRGRGRHGDHYFEPEVIQAVDDKHFAPKRALLRQWCGDEAGERQEELVELRKEIRRVGEIAERAISALRSCGQRSIADRLGHELGQTVEMVRVDSSGE
jgi:hypothetical protein